MSTKTFIKFDKSIYGVRVDLQSIISYSSSGNKKLSYSTKHLSGNHVYFNSDADRDEALSLLDKHLLLKHNR